MRLRDCRTYCLTSFEELKAASTAIAFRASGISEPNHTPACEHPGDCIRPRSIHDGGSTDASADCRP